jgi:hypothetical protein
MRANWQEGKGGAWQLGTKDSEHVTWILREKQTTTQRAGMAWCASARTQPLWLTAAALLDNTFWHSRLVTRSIVSTGKATFKACLMLEVLKYTRNISTNTPNWLKHLWKTKVFGQRGKSEGARLLLLVCLFSLRCRTETPTLTDFQVLISF